jgi:hypothetical protein
VIRDLRDPSEEDLDYAPPPGTMTSAWTLSALRGALIATGIAALIALSAAMVRVLPWVLDPAVTWRVATPFARSLAVVALEAALAVGWPLGWTLATLSLVERGEGRVLRLLGERPLRTCGRLTKQGVVLASLLAALSWMSAQQSSEPGRVVTELIAEGEAACEKATVPRTYAVPFFGATWLCAPGVPPRLVGQGPGRLSELVFSARHARTSEDLGSIALDDAHVALPQASLRVDSVRLRGAAPWGHGATVGPIARAASLSATVTLCAFMAVALVLLHRAKGRIGALTTGAAGPVAALGALRVLERFAVTRSWLVLAVPPLALATLLGVAWVGARLPGLWQTGRA